MSGPKPSYAFVAPKCQEQKRNLDECAIDLQTTINQALPLVSLGHRRVAVLSFTWSNDTVGVKAAEQELLGVFKDCYGFAVESFVIQANLTKMQLTSAFLKKILDFARYWDGEDYLTIYMYSGHGVYTKNRNFQKYLIAGQADQKGLVEPSFDWIGMSSGIQYQVGDVLVVFDSCYASQSAILDGPEFLAIANRGSVTGSILNTSLAKELTAQLKLLGGNPCSVSQLFGKIHRSAMDNNIVGVPLHIPRPQKDSIILQKLENTDETRQSKRMKHMQIGALEDSESRVLLAVRLQDATGIP